MESLLELGECFGGRESTQHGTTLTKKVYVCSQYTIWYGIWDGPFKGVVAML